MITRSNPAVGYMAADVFKTNAFTQTIRAGNTLYLSGIAPLKGELNSLELVGEGSMQVQTEWVLEILKRCLAAEGATLRNWVAQTVYVTDIAESIKTMAIFNEFFGEHTPTSTLVEVKGLFHPQQMTAHRPSNRGNPDVTWPDAQRNLHHPGTRSRRPPD